MVNVLNFRTLLFSNEMLVMSRNFQKCLNNQKRLDITCISSASGTGPHSTVGNVRDCISRGSEFDPSQVPYFCGD